jgi:chromosome segregation ATPase
MDLKARLESLRSELQSKWNELNDLESRRQALMNEALILQGKIAMLQELLQEEEPEKVVLEED